MLHIQVTPSVAHGRAVAARAFSRWLDRRLWEGWVILATATLDKWEQRRHSRCVLARMDDRGLRDLGLSRADAWAECQKPFWKG